ncbi:hypothetical protein [Pseudohalocynthiibacter sp. F2068]|uniref:hypothetical protein n=1 Tax=Pseudohalocynthiibacter sp. F2068 TaxID=2926418 RepID=UPI001FF4ACA5|nr:hypothetical protein [Pseudohalocynthiibacter sp. F2068]MCK0103233.1 hypothetical protein [Pseudohalocynthiibacter sp. F2068]
MFRLFTYVILMFSASFANAGNFEVTARNMLPNEHLTQLVIAPTTKDRFFFRSDGRLTAAARVFAIEGNPDQLARRIGRKAVIGDGTATIDGFPGQTLPLGAAVFTMQTRANRLRIMAMIGPEIEPDSFVIGVADLSEGAEVVVPLARYDLGVNEGTNTRVLVSRGDIVVTFRRLD